MKKNLIMVGIVFLFAGIVFGQAIGTIITQAQFDVLNFSDRPLNIAITAKDKTDSVIAIGILYKTLEKNVDKNWVVAQKEKTFYYRLEDYFNCRVLNGSIANCTQNVVDTVSAQIVQFREHEREFLTGQKTRQFIDELNPNNLVFDENALNNDRKP